MKSPADLRLKLRRQWEKAAYRESRLLAADAWPVVLSIGKPTPKKIQLDLDGVKRHVEAWRQVNIGQVIWEEVSYRQTAQAVSVPIIWKLNKPTDWIDATGNAEVRRESQSMASLVENSSPVFHSLWVRKRSLWLSKSLEEVIQAARLALLLAPGCAEGRPLRTLALEGIDTKFFERNAALITTLMDVRFENEVGRIGLETFLGALHERDHWLLLVDLDGGLLPFQKIRVKAAELNLKPLPGQRVLIVENESAQHQLPQVPETIAVLGAGFDLNWMKAAWLSSKQVGYWGDIDTWGLQFLAKARQAVPHLNALLISEEVFVMHLKSAVSEPVVAGTEVPSGLRADESRLYRRLLGEAQGRLEQEYLPIELVQRSILEWAHHR